MHIFHEMAKLDEKDLKILRVLQSDSSLSIKEISRRLGIPVTTIHARIKKLEKKGVIKAYRAILDGNKVGIGTTAFVLASFAYRLPGRGEPLSQREVAEEIAKFPEVQEVHIITGDWDILIKVRAGSVDEIGKFVVDKLRKVRGVEKTLTCMVFETAKETTELNI